MKTKSNVLSSGLPGLDKVLRGILPGDNVVWEVDSIEDYVPWLKPFWTEAKRRRRKLIYFRFANHRPLLSEAEGAEVHCLNAEAGFEKFVSEILDVIEQAGRGAFYIFDCLSDLAADWFSDRMLGNFFMITCPFLYKLDTVTYFALLKNEHSFHATDGINNTAQVIIEVFRKDDRLFIHPLKVFERHSPTLYMLHSWEG
ncbi:MAG: pyruvate, phosphate dikinase, partial [Verrucomicrobiae bacterium]|nr:pyruvate, phosphate dikinase [Verrucomicrobiae bacterium]